MTTIATILRAAALLTLALMASCVAAIAVPIHRAGEPPGRVPSDPARALPTPAPPHETGASGFILLAPGMSSNAEALTVREGAP